MDFHCACGAFCHFDGDFAYVVRCPHCKTIYEMPHVIYPRAVTKETCDHWQTEEPKNLSPDDDECDNDGEPFPREPRADLRMKPAGGVEVTDEMVERALEAFMETGEFCNMEYRQKSMRAALSAALKGSQG